MSEPETRSCRGHDTRLGISDVHRCVGALVDDLLRVVHEVPEHHLHDEWGDYPYTLAQQLGLLSRVGALIAGQLADWHAGRRTVLGLSAQSAELEDALVRARVSRLEPLQAKVETAWAQVRSEIDELEGRHLRATVNDAFRGREPLATWVATEVLQRGRDFVNALRAMLDEIDALWPTRWPAGDVAEDVGVDDK